MKKFQTIFMVCLLVCVTVFFYIQTHIETYKQHVYTQKNVPEQPVALVFGAGIRANGTLSDALQDRVDTATELYAKKKVTKLLFSGDNGSVFYDEVTAMKTYAVTEKNIPDEDIVLDYAGFDTYDSCYRARDIFEVDSAILVTQSFHLPRALFICNTLGISSTGIAADKREYLYASQYQLREYAARVKAWFEVMVFHTKPTYLGKKEPIFNEQ